MTNHCVARGWLNVAWSGILALSVTVSAAAQVSVPASPGRRFPRTDLALGVLGDLELGGVSSGSGNKYMTLNVGGRLDVVPTLPFVGHIAYEKNIGKSQGPLYTLTVGTGFKFADRVGREDMWVATGGGEINPYVSYVDFAEVAGLARHYQVLRAGFLAYQYDLGFPGPTMSSGFFVGYSRNTLLQADAPSQSGMPGLRAVNTLALDLLVGSVAPSAPKTNKLGFRGSWTHDLGNIASTRLEVGLRPALGYFSVVAVEVFFLKSGPWF